MNMKLLAFFAVGVFVIGFASLAGAGSLTINYNNGTTQITSGLAGATTFGDDMDGMAVTVNFAGGGSETAYWADGAVGTGSAAGTGWTLSESGDTWPPAGGVWTLATDANTSISSFYLDAGLGDNVFDIDTSPSSPGSGSGGVFSITGGTGDNYDITANYFNIVRVDGILYGDLYRNLGITFDPLATGAPNPFGPLSRLSFQADTDILAIPGDIQPVPEPTTMLLLGTGLVGVAGAARRKKKNQA